jgi:hypothetical protein
MYWKKFFPGITYLFALVLVLFIFELKFPLFLLCQEKVKSQEGSTHFILLVDATGPVGKVFFPKDSNYADGRYFQLLRTALNTNPNHFNRSEDVKEKIGKDAVEYKTFNNQRDMVTFVFFHFPLVGDSQDKKIKGEQYFYTSKDLIAVENFLSDREKIERFLNMNEGLKKIIPTSPIEFSKKMVFPYLCEEYEKCELPVRKNKIVERIVIITVSDKDDVPINEERFVKNEDKEKFKKWQLTFNQNFEYVPLNPEPNYILYDNSTCNAKPESSKYLNAIYFDYSEVKPVLKDVEWGSDAGAALERVAKREVHEKDGNIFWKGDSGITHFNKGNYKGFIEWAPEPESGYPLNWQPIEKNFHGEILFNEITPPLHIYIKKIPGDDSQIYEDAKNFNKSVNYRAVITDFMKKHHIFYPFEFRTYTAAKKIAYRSKEVENNEYKIPSYFVHKVGSVKKQGPITDALLKKIFKEYDGSVDELSAFAASSWSDDKAQEQSKAFLTTAAVTASSLVILLIIILLLSRYARNPKIRARVTRDIDTRKIPLDFSENNRETKELAVLELSNTRKFLSKKRRHKPFNLDLLLSFSANPGVNFLDYEGNQLLKIKKISDQEEDSQNLPLRKTGNFYMVDLPGICAGSEFKIVLDPNAIKDLDIAGEAVGEKEVTFQLALEKLSGNFVKNGDPLPVKKIKNQEKDWMRSFVLLFKPEIGTMNITFQEVDEEKNKDFVEIEPDTYTIPYSANHPVQELFQLTAANGSVHRYSKPLRADLSYKVLEGVTPLDTNDIFYLVDNPSWPGEPGPKTGYSLAPGWGEKVKFYFYINFQDMDNPHIPRNFQINIFKDGSKVEGCSKSISVTRSKEKTEALIQIYDESGKASIENKEKGVFNQHHEMIVNETGEDVFPLTVVVPGENHKDIIEAETTYLFTLRLKNNCKTREGYYRWKISGIKLQDNNQISINEEIKEKEIIVDHSQMTGDIPDIESHREEIKFSLNGRMVKLMAYQLTFEITFNLLLEFFPGGKLKEETKKKQVNVKAKINGIHRVIPNYLIVDFGTSAIAVEYCDNSVGPASGQATNALLLQSMDGLMESEDGLIPSILNINKDKTVGTDEFVKLPAEKNLVSLKPELLLSAIKLMILEGERKIQIPKGFQCLDEKGNPLEYGDFLDLGSVVKSAYKNLKNIYIKKHVKEYRRLIFTYPNVYNETHKLFLKEILKEVFVDKEDSVYQENIFLVSESNAVLYDYLQQRAGEAGKPGHESILICDVGGGTLDVSLADVTWEKETPYPAEINIIDRDGIAFAGEVLDKAIALQVHRILHQYEEKCGMPEEPKATGTQILSDQETGIKGTKGRATANKKFYHRRIAEDGSADDDQKPHNLLQSMFEFKYYHILQFKKNMSSSTSTDFVKICLGDNDDQKGLCLMKGDEIPLMLEFEGRYFDSCIKNEGGILYLYLKKNDWLNLPYIKRYKELFTGKIKLFLKTTDKQLSASYTVILSGRTSLWPGIPEAAEELLKAKPIYISGNDPGKKDVKLKRAVTEGAMQKVVEWPHIKCRDPKSIGVPALNYKDKAGPSRPGNWTIKILKENEPVKIDLNNSPHFQLGIKTSMDFIPFIGGACYERERFCRLGSKKKKVKIHLQPANNVIGWKFFIEQDEEDKTAGKSREKSLIELPVDPRTETSGLNLKGTHWPLKKVQLPDVDPKDFNETT